MWNKCNCMIASTFFGILSLGLEWKLTFSSSLASSEISKSAEHILCSTLAVLPFRVLNSSAGILSPPLALLIVMFPTGLLSSHSRMSGSRWVTTPSLLSRSLSPFFLYSSSVYFCHLFLTSSASLRSLSFLYFLCPSLYEMFPWYCQFSWRDLYLFPFYCFPLFHCAVHLRTLISPCCSLELCIQLGVSFPFSFAFCFFPHLFVRAPQTTTLPSCISFSLRWFWSLPPVQCYKSLSIVLQALYHI